MGFLNTNKNIIYLKHFIFKLINDSEQIISDSFAKYFCSTYNSNSSYDPGRIIIESNHNEIDIFTMEIIMKDEVVNALVKLKSKRSAVPDLIPR